jgi:5'-nucleotidase
VHQHADTAIVAPDTEKSGSGMSITWAKPLIIREIPWEKQTPSWSVNGTPADCVKLAISTILPENFQGRMPDLVISGVNRGSNAGRTPLYSGTVGAVIEGIFKGIPGIAFSFSDVTIPPLEVTQKYIYPIIHHFLNHPLPAGTLLNVNFPLNCATQIKGVRLAKQGKGYWIEKPEKRLHPEGDPYYWLAGKWPMPTDEDAESDVSLLHEGYITAVPIRIRELTDEAAYLSLKDGVERAFSPLQNSFSKILNPSS